MLEGLPEMSKDITFWEYYLISCMSYGLNLHVHVTEGFPPNTKSKQYCFLAITINAHSDHSIQKCTETSNKKFLQNSRGSRDDKTMKKYRNKNALRV